jgi:hypothetical protein
MRWPVHVSHMADMRNMYNILIGKPEVTSPIRRSVHRWVNIKFHIQEICDNVSRGFS